MIPHKEAIVSRSQNLESRPVSMVYTYLLAGITLLIAVFLYVLPASAQSVFASAETTSAQAVVESQIVEDTSVQSEIIAPIEQIDPQLDSVADQAAIEDVAQDQTISYQDLGAEVPAILPDSPLYGFKRFGRGLRKAFTFNKVKKIELEVRYANQELADAQQLVNEKQHSPAAAESAAKAIKKFQEELQSVRNRSEALPPADAKRIVENILDKQIKQQKVLSHIEERLLDSDVADEIKDRVVARIENAKDRSADYVANTIGRIEENQDRLAQNFDNVLQRQRGSEFKDLRNLEILDRLEDYVPEQSREAFKNAEHGAIKRFSNSVENIPEELRSIRFEKYVDHFGGDDARHLEIFDKIKNSDNLSQQILSRIEKAKDISAQKFKEKFESYNSEFGESDIAQRFRQRALNEFKNEEGVDIGKLRALDEFRQRVQFEDERIKVEIDRQHDSSINDFINEINKAKGQDSSAAAELTDAAKEFKRLSKEISENPNPTAFRLLEELELKVKSDPDAAAILSRLESESKMKFAERSVDEGEEFFNKVISNNPKDIEIFKKLQEDFRSNPEHFFGPRSNDKDSIRPGQGPDGNGPPPFSQQNFTPPNFDQVFDRVIRVHANGVAEHVNNINDPVLLQNFERRIQDIAPEVLERIKQEGGDIKEVLQKRRNFVETEEERNKFFEQNIGRDFNTQNGLPVIPSSSDEAQRDQNNQLQNTSDQRQRLLGRAKISD